jgi:hypothetical protein
MSKNVSPAAAVLVIIAVIAIIAVLYLFVFTGKQPGHVGGPPHGAVQAPAPKPK